MDNLITSLCRVILLVELGLRDVDFDSIYLYDDREDATTSKKQRGRKGHGHRGSLTGAAKASAES